MVSPAASFGKRVVAASPRAAAPSPEPASEQPDSRPASVVASRENAPIGRPIAVSSPGRLSRWPLWLTAVIGVGVSLYFYPLPHGDAPQASRFITPADLPHDIETMKAHSFALVQKYPHDPRSHLFRGLYFLGKRDASDAEPYLRSALLLGNTSAVMTSDLQVWTRALLAVDLRAQGRGEEGRSVAAPLCGRAGLDMQTQSTLTLGKLCQ